MSLADDAKAATGGKLQEDSLGTAPPGCDISPQELTLTLKDGREMTPRARQNAWTIESLDEVKKLTVSEALAIAEPWANKGWVVGQTRRMISGLAEPIARRSAAGVVSAKRMGEPETRERARGVVNLVDELDAANLAWYANDSQ
jgi:hypothetical protein